MDTHLSGRGEVVEENTNPGSEPIRRLVRKEPDYSTHLDLPSLGNNPEGSCRVFSALASDWLDYDALGHDFIQISLDSVRGGPHYRFNCNRVANCRKLVAGNVSKMLGYRDSVDKVREFLDGDWDRTRN